jgi:16S rRNA G966 N2-methylase RsmD
MQRPKAWQRLSKRDLSARAAGVVATTLRRFQWSLQKHGLAGTAKRLVFLILMPQWQRRKDQEFQAWLAFTREQDGDFDKTYDVDTGGIVRLRELAVVGQHWVAGVEYQGIAVVLFDEIMEQLDIHHEQYAFVDLGSGKGRALLLAAARPFRQIVGVEFSKELTAIAQRNIERYTGPRVCNHIEAVNADAAECRLPASPFIVFMNNPFGEAVMSPVASHIIRAAQGSTLPSYVIYSNPRLRQVLDVQFGTVVMEGSTGDGYVIYQV